jgi:hypothetical protein
METALVAVADARHPEGGRAMADEAFDQLLKWLERGSPRRLGDDAAAVALTARAARELRGGNAQLTAQAAELVDEVCSTRADLAALHVALVTWALDPLIADRARPPWDAIRAAIPSLNRSGVNEALARLSAAIAHENAPVVDVGIAYVGVQDQTEQCILVWVLGVAIALNTGRGFASTDQLAPFSERQTQLLAHLATQLAARPIGLADVQDFDPEEELLEEPDGLPLFEAVLLDLSLSGPPAARRMLTEEQADARTAQATRGARRWIAGGLAGVSALVAAFAAVIGILAHATTHLWTGIALTVVCLGLSFATWLARAQTRYNVAALLVGLWLEALVGVLLILEGIFGWPHVDDGVALIIGVVVLGGPPLLQALAERVTRE